MGLGWIEVLMRYWFGCRNTGLLTATLFSFGFVLPARLPLELGRGVGGDIYICIWSNGRFDFSELVFLAFSQQRTEPKGFNGGLWELVLCVYPKKKEQDEQITSTIVWRIQHEVLVEFVRLLNVWKMNMSATMCAWKVVTGTPSRCLKAVGWSESWRSRLTLLTTLGVWCEIVTPLKSIQMTLWHRYSTTNQSVEEVVYVTPLVILRIKMSNILEVNISHQANRTQTGTEEMLQADLIAWSASISACAARGQWQHALYLMSEMQRHLVLPNIVSSMRCRECGMAGDDW